MQRVLVVGPCGAGKSTLARRLGERLGLAVEHLDAHYWQPGWQETPDDEWEHKVQELIARPHWVIDGTYASTLPLRLPRADTIIYLDFPRTTCVRHVLQRVWRYHGRKRPDMGPGCTEKLDLEFLWYTWRYHRDVTPRIRTSLQAIQPTQKLLVMHSPREVNDFLCAL